MTEFDRQVDVLVQREYPSLLGYSEPEFRARTEPLRALAERIVTEPERPGARFALVTPVPPRESMPRTALGSRPGFVDRLLPDVEKFAPIEEVGELPSFYLVSTVERGEEFCGWVPDKAMLTVAERGRTPLTIAEGIALLTTHPELLERNKCFSLGGSRCGDRRVPALWISQKAPKLGWCWAGNPHTWLGMASCGNRLY
ncbi:DUF5701 family protein [Sciscionella sediminilitoris]|uniref:DUF5701 family protein n=1 Tax=Sciscionella sediminilitoris TaxID=1445613 RepID=UPI0004DF6721|nr:DUF5701 family protein [Sciscionella sp. SE31]